MSARPVGIFGGAFAPFHNGHLRLALEARMRLQLESVRLVPTAHPPHRPDSHIAPQRRYEWVRLAIRREKALVADDCEILREGPSYTIDTLAALKRKAPDTPLVLLIGADAFAHFHTWHRWSEIPALAHLAVVARAGAPLEPPAGCAGLFQGRDTEDPIDLQRIPAGRWIRLDLPLLEISSTRVRRLLRARQSVRGLVPDAILNSMTPADIARLTKDDDATTH